MTTSYPTPKSVTPATWVAIDIAKDAHVILVARAAGQRRLRVANTLADIEQLIAFLRTQPATVRIAFEPDPLPALKGTPVFIGAGRTDSVIPAEQPAALHAVLRKAGAQVHLHWEPGGHSITPTELKAARQWLRA